MKINELKQLLKDHRYEELQNHNISQKDWNCAPIVYFIDHIINSTNHLSDDSELPTPEFIKLSNQLIKVCNSVSPKKAYYPIDYYHFLHSLLKGIKQISSAQFTAINQLKFLTLIEELQRQGALDSTSATQL